MGDVIHPTYENGAHAPLSPSAAKRWMACPGSVAICAEAAGDTSEAAEQGSAAHALAEICLKENTNPVDYLGQQIASPDGTLFLVNSEWVEALTLYVDTVRETEGDLQVEQKFVIYEDLCFGTADADVLSPVKLTVYDLKFGAGVEVDPLWSEQMLIYALGAIRTRPYGSIPMDFPVDLVIVQPRHFKDKKVKRFETTVGAIMDWEEYELLPAIDRCKPVLDRIEYQDFAEMGGLYFPGDEQCKWCPGCPEIAKQAVLLADEPCPVDFPADVAEFNPEQLAAAIGVEAAFKKWVKLTQAKFDAVKTRSVGMLEGGLSVPGYKLVAGRKKPGKWTDEVAAAKLAKGNGVEAYESKLLTPAKMRKAFKSEGVDPDALEALVITEQGVEIAPESSKKKAIPVTADAVFADVKPQKAD